MPLTASSLQQEHGMDKSTTQSEGQVPSTARTLPLSESEAEVAPSSSNSARSSFEQIRFVDGKRSSLTTEPTRSSGPRDIILKAFLPRVAVYASQDTEELIRLKGIFGGLCGLLRPFGEQVSGKVGIRDSNGISRFWEDFGVHFIPFEKGERSADLGQNPVLGVEDSIQEGDWSRILKAAPEKSRSQSTLDEVVDRCINSSVRSDAGESSENEQDPGYYNLFLRKILANRPLVPHDTFSHLVACVIAISSQTPDPISTLSDLYHSTRAESGILPRWVSNSFLRYYVLVHDEDHDDLTISTNLFAQMKRHYGLHCHMLRLRSVECTREDADAGPLPRAHWLDADEDAEELQQRDSASEGDFQQYIFDSDAAIIRTFVRELVTQSIIPYMENRVTTWNDQVASKRKGVTGRLMSMSKRWTSFGSVRGRNTPVASADRDFDHSQGAYKPESSIALMHRLADYALMLRDWKLSASTYDLLRSDFNDDKAWQHYAEAHEMSAISLLLMGQSAHSRGRVETVNQLLDTAVYSFITRCNSPVEASRCMFLAMELYMNNAGIGSKEAPRWGKRLLELSISSQLVQALLAERIAAAYAYPSAFADGSPRDGIFRRSAFWNLLASEMWTRLHKPDLADRRLQAAKLTYESPTSQQQIAAFHGTLDYLEHLSYQVSDMGRAITPTAKQELDTFMEDATANADLPSGHVPRHRYSRSTVHRRGLSQQNVLKAVGRQEDSQQMSDDGFS